MKYLTLIAFLFASVASADTLMPTSTSPELFLQEDRPEEYCLALNIYFEARNDNLAGKYGVADVVLNRVADPRYPSTVCSVVYEGLQNANGQMIRHKCQFSWYCDGLPDEPNKESDSWGEAQLIAYYIYTTQRFRGISEGATHYHATYVDPAWARKLDHVGRIGEHLFYRWP